MNFSEGEIKDMKKLVSLDEVMAALPKKRRDEIEARGEQLIAEIRQRMTLAEMRKHRKITQMQLAETLGINQVQVSRLERRKDPRLSTLQRTVATMGGHLTIIATFPDQEPIVLVASNLAKLSATPKKSREASRNRA